MSSISEGFGQVVPKAQAGPQALARAVAATKAQPEASPDTWNPAAPIARPPPRPLAPQPVQKAEHSAQRSYAHHAAVNAELIQKTAAAMRANLDAQGLAPEDVTVAFLIDVTGIEKSICVACNVEGHDYQPELFRFANPEIDLLSEFYVVANEAAEQAGVRHATVIYDDKMVAVARYPDSVDAQEGLDFFNLFREQEDARDQQDPAFAERLEQERKTWTPEGARVGRVGEPLDRRAFDVGAQLAGESGPRGLIVVKGHAPTSLLSLAGQLRSRGVSVVGVAVGEKAVSTARHMPAGTLTAQRMHDLRAMLDPAFTRIAEEAGGA
jgi:hypothetical protein